MDSIRFSGSGFSRQLRPVAVMKALELGGMLLFGIVAPRLMGPDLFGELAVILSVSGLLAMLCAMGSGQFVFGRFVPEYVTRGEWTQVRALFMHVLQFRAAASCVAAPVLFLLLQRLLPGAGTATLLASTGAFVTMSVAAPMYAVFFGFNRLALSMSRNSLARFLLLALLLAFGASTSLERASYALLVAQLCALGAGLALTRSLFTLEAPALELVPLLRHIRFGAEVFLSTSLLHAPRQLGETVLGFAGVASAQIGFFNLARTATGAISEVLGHVPHFLIPSLSRQQVDGDLEARDRNLGLSLKYLSILAIFGVLGILASSSWLVHLLLGDDFQGTVPHLFVLAALLPPVPLVWTALSLSVVRTRALRSMQMGAAGLVAFGVVASSTTDQGALGVSIALAAAGIAAGVVAAWQMRDTTVLTEAKALRHLVAVVGIAAIALPFDSFPVRGVVAAIAFFPLLLALRVVTVSELRSVLRAAIQPHPSLSRPDSKGP